jgi:hypothetical protein
LKPVLGSDEIPLEVVPSNFTSAAFSYFADIEECWNKVDGVAKSINFMMLVEPCSRPVDEHWNPVAALVFGSLFDRAYLH